MMTKRAWAYVISVFIIGLALAGYTLARFLDEPGIPLAFYLFTALATIAQLFKAEAPTHQLYHPTLLFLFAGALILEPFLMVCMVITYHVVEWAKERLVNSPHLRAWYLQPFNIATHLTAGLVGRGIFILFLPQPETLGNPLAMGAAIAAAAGCVLANHYLVGQALVLARGTSWKDSGILDTENLLIDFMMLIMGYNVALLYRQHNPWVILPAIAPLYLIYRALAVPFLRHKARTDPKTGLWNAEYFMQVLEAELNRSSRYYRPVTVVMADLDLLRNINNAYGHLAGDAVLIGTGKILKDSFREYDVVSRFGGEEFAIMMPETTPEDAWARIEGIRRTVSQTIFISPINKQKIRVTMSFGLASNNSLPTSVKELIHRADLAVYHAKMGGRNRTMIYRREYALMPEASQFILPDDYRR